MAKQVNENLESQVGWQEKRAQELEDQLNELQYREEDKDLRLGELKKANTLLEIQVAESEQKMT